VPTSARASTITKYQLVLQFPCDPFSDTGGRSALEEELIKTLGDGVYVDGHDLGVSDTSFFIFTPDPAATFGRASEVLERWDLMESVTAAHREADAEQYTVIWPHDCRKTFKITQTGRNSPESAPEIRVASSPQSSDPPPTAQEQQQVITALREELQQYGEMLALLDQQQDFVMRRANAETLRQCA
jgi:hypothetical protein